MAKDIEIERRLGAHATYHLNMPICSTCSTQTSETRQSHAGPEECIICADPRQYIGYSGQHWTSLGRLLNSKDGISYHNRFDELIKSQVWTMTCSPKFGIGQRVFFIKDATVNGLVMWDCSAYVDDETLAFVDEISDGQGVAHCVISHPHYYSTSFVWAALFPKMKIWLPKQDFKEWHPRGDVVEAKFGSKSQPAAKIVADQIQLVTEEQTKFSDNSLFTILRLGGHFPEALVLHWNDILFVADIVQIVPSGIYNSKEKQRPGVTTFTFMWSYPNQIPLSISEVQRVCEPLQDFEFDKAFGAFDGYNIWGYAKEKVFQSRDIIIRRLSQN